MNNTAIRNDICQDLGQLFDQLNHMATISNRRARSARGQLLDQIGRHLDQLRRLDLFMDLACR